MAIGCALDFFTFLIGFNCSRVDDVISNLDNLKNVSGILSIYYILLNGLDYGWVSYAKTSEDCGILTTLVFYFEIIISINFGLGILILVVIIKNS